MFPSGADGDASLNEQSTPAWETRLRSTDQPLVGLPRLSTGAILTVLVAGCRLSRYPLIAARAEVPPQDRTPGFHAARAMG